MGHFTPLKRDFSAGATSQTLPMTTPIVPRRRRTHKSVDNLKITLLCGIVTILVLRGTIGVNRLPDPNQHRQQQLLQEADRVVADIRSDRDPDDEPSRTSNTTYSLGPKIGSWDKDREIWLNQNPNFPHYVNGKPRILLVTGSQPSPCENPIGDHFLLKSIKNKVDYCRIHGIEIVYNMAHLDTELSGYWAKLPLIRTLLLAHPEVEWLWWMDSDAMFTDMIFEIPISK